MCIVNEMIAKYYESKKWRKHAVQVIKISDEIVECYKSYLSAHISKLTESEVLSIKLACAFHDVTRKKDVSKNQHASKSATMFKDHIWDDIKEEDFLKDFNKNERKEIKKSTAHAIENHNDRKAICSQSVGLIVSTCVYASDKITHICQDNTVKTYCEESIKILKLIKKIRKKHLNTPSVDLMCYCIIQVLVSKYPY